MKIRAFAIALSTMTMGMTNAHAQDEITQTSNTVPYAPPLLEQVFLYSHADIEAAICKTLA